MWQTLRDNPEVLWGFLLALVVVLVLTPAVGRFGAHSRRRRRAGRAAAHPSAPGPAPRRDRALPRDLHAGARVPHRSDGDTAAILLGAAVATVVGVVDDFRGLRWWEKLGGQVSPRRSRSASGSASTASRSRFVGIQTLPDWVGHPADLLWIVAIMNMVNFLDGMDGLAAGICAIAGGDVRASSRSRSASRRRRSSRRSSPAPASASCATTSTRRGSSWATPGRCCSGSCSRRSRSRAS